MESQILVIYFILNHGNFITSSLAVLKMLFCIFSNHLLFSQMDFSTLPAHPKVLIPRVVSWLLTRKVAIRAIQSSPLNSCWPPWSSVQLQAPVVVLVPWSQQAARLGRLPRPPSLPLQISHLSCRKCPRSNKHLRDALYLPSSLCLLLPRSLSAHLCQVLALVLQVAVPRLEGKGAAVKQTG